jgi:hypothetical protein
VHPTGVIAAARSGVAGREQTRSSVGPRGALFRTKRAQIPRRVASRAALPTTIRRKYIQPTARQLAFVEGGWSLRPRAAGVAMAQQGTPVDMSKLSPAEKDAMMQQVFSNATTVRAERRARPPWSDRCGISRTRSRRRS